MSELPGPWETTFYDLCDPETGHRFGVLERSRVIATTPCIGCRLYQTDPENAVTQTHEVWADGEREEDRVGCFCDEQEAAGLTSWRLNPAGSLAATPETVCPRCGGSGHCETKSQRRYQCGACNVTGWRDGRVPGAMEEVP